MKILSVLHPLLNDYQVNGAAILATSLGEYFNNTYKDIQVDYIASASLYNIVDSSKSIIWVPNNIRKSRGTLDTIEFAKQVFLDNNYDIMHINITQMSVLSAINNILKGIPIIYTQHTASISGRFSLNYKDAAKELSNNPNIRIVCPSNSMLNIWRDYIGCTTPYNSVSVIRNGIKEYNLSRGINSKDSDYYISVGRLEPAKNMLDIAELCDKYNHKIVFISGTSQGTMKITPELQEYFDQFDEICERRKDIITRYHYLSNDQIRNLMLNSRGYISLSTLESYGLAVAEATMSGLPLFFLEEDATKEFASDKTSVMIPKALLYRKSHNTRIDIYEKYLKQFEAKLISGEIDNNFVSEHSHSLKLTIEDCAEEYLKLYKELLA